MPIDRAALAENLRLARIEKGFSQQELATRVGVATETISRFERGAFEPALSTAFDLSRALGLTIDVMIGSAGRSAKGKPEKKAPERRAAPKAPARNRAIKVIKAAVQKKAAKR